MAKGSTYRIVLIPKLTENDSNIEALAEKFRAFRLHSLQAAPDAFASTYEVESQRGLDHTIGRLINQKAAQFVALRSTGLDEDDTETLKDVDLLLGCEWVGMAVLLGPEEGDELSIPSANLDPFVQMTAGADTAYYNSTRLFESSSNTKDIHFHINGTFVSPSTRGSGLGGRLMDVAVRYGDDQAAKTGRQLRVTLSVYGHNTAAIHLYEKAGFKVVKETDSRSKPGSLAVHMQLDRLTPS
ncbi:hypothetical protein LTR09_002685 [Extremus antarcticus]|uniref:N-acetyltransferase domain-containing protein n=1 Tax=Extremus antarcticus TaxID=702011 RepID=A0AAJ0LUL0_9PEZI|nr:hypothetical protein LTR09_002685 [Extremus antarcticus]